jgi:putative restriction endonuclease
VLHATARALVEGEFPATLIPDVLTAVGLDADAVYGTGVVSAITAAAQLVLVGHHLGGVGPAVRRSADSAASWGPVRWAGGGTRAVVQLRGSWCDADNGLALCALLHRLFDRGVLGLSDSCRVQVSSAYSARTPTGRAGA